MFLVCVVSVALNVLFYILPVSAKCSLPCPDAQIYSGTGAIVVIVTCSACELSNVKENTLKAAVKLMHVETKCQYLTHIG